MKRSFTALAVCLLVAVAANAQETNSVETQSPVENVTLAKTGPDGNIIENPESFSAMDIPIFCYVDLKEAKSSAIKVKYIAVKAVGLRPNLVIVTLEYKTKDGEIGAAFDAKPAAKWALGDYRVDVYVNGTLVENKEFKVIEK